MCLTCGLYLPVRFVARTPPVGSTTAGSGSVTDKETISSPLDSATAPVCVCSISTEDSSRRSLYDVLLPAPEGKNSS